MALPWGPGLQGWGVAEAEITEALLKPGGDDGAGGKDRPSRGTAHAKAWGGTQHSSDGLQQGTLVG